METMTYVKAASELGKSRQAIFDAVKYNNLTKYVTRNKRPCLIKEQVMLFKNKPQISKKYLNDQELSEWNRWDKFAQGVFSNTQVNDDTKTFMDYFVATPMQNMPDSSQRAVIGAALGILVGAGVLSPLALGSLLTGLAAGLTIKSLSALIQYYLNNNAKGTKQTADEVLEAIPDEEERSRVRSILEAS